jgi:hypothetical protein
MLAGVKPSTSFIGSIAAMIFAASIPAGSGICTRIPCTAGFSLSTATWASSAASDKVSEWRMSKTLNPTSCAALFFGADISRARRIAADQHHREAGNEPVAVRQPGGFGCDFRTQARRDRFAVDDARGHDFFPSEASV